MIDQTLINENTDSIIQSLSAGIEHDRGFSELYNINCSRAAAKLDHYLATVSENQCYNNVVEKSEPGSIIVFHDSEKASLNMMYSLPKVLDYFSKKGYNFKRIPE